MNGMKKFNLTEKNQKIIDQIYDDYSNLVEKSGKDLTLDEVRDDVIWMYGLEKLGAPDIIICDSPKACQDEANRLNNTTNEYYSFVGGLLWRAYYMSWFEACERIGLDIDSSMKKTIKTQINFMKKGVYDMICFDTHCIISKLPISVKRDDRGRLHSVTSPAVEFRDGYSMYAISGIVFDYDLWKKITDRVITTDELLSIKNVDQRFVAMQFIGFENIISKLDKKLIDESKYGNMLYETKFNDVVCKMLVYPDIDDHSKNRIAFVDPKITRASDAMAWKHGCTEEEYMNADILKIWNKR